jgi:hypothetical protein
MTTRVLFMADRRDEDADGAVIINATMTESGDHQL